MDKMEERTRQRILDLANLADRRRRSAGYKVCLYDAQRAECNFELQWRQSCGSETLRVSFPVQRMCKSYHTVRDQRGDL